MELRWNLTKKTFDYQQERMEFEVSTLFSCGGCKKAVPLQRQNRKCHWMWKEQMSVSQVALLKKIN